MKVQITVSIENDEMQKLVVLAEEKSRTVRDVIRFAVTAYIKAESQKVPPEPVKKPPVLKAKKKGAK